MPRDSNSQKDRLDISDFAKLFGTSTQELSPACSADIMSQDFQFKSLSNSQRDNVILQVLKRVASPDLTVAGDEDARIRWERGWNENLKEFRKDRNLANLVPKYVRKGQPLRLFGDYVQPSDEDFELNWFAVLRRWLFETYLKDVDAVYEFGCGTGYNLAALANIFPDKSFYGLDWSMSSVRIVNALSRAYGWKMKGIPFDFASPDASVKLDQSSAVITIDALEQVGHNYDKFLRFLLRKKPEICIHIEPVVEWYDGNKLLDYLAIMFHRRRGYLEGFVPRLLELRTEGRAKLIKLRRTFFGSLYTEGYSQVIWKPVVNRQ